MVVSAGTDFSALSEYLNEPIEQAPVYFGDLDLSFYGVRLAFFRQGAGTAPAEARQVLFVFTNARVGGFQAELDGLRGLADLGVAVLVVVQNSWEGNMGALLRRAEVDERFGVLYDTNNVFGVVREIAGVSGGRGQKQPENGNSATFHFFFEDGALFSADLGVAGLAAHCKNARKRAQIDAENARLAERKRAATKARLLLNDAKPFDRVNTAESVRRVFDIYARSGAVGVQEAFRAAKGEQQPADGLQEAFNQTESEAGRLSLDQFKNFVEKMGWKLRERFIPHEEAYQAKFNEISANGAVPLDKFLECARDAGLNELVAQTAFSEVDTSDGAGLNYE